MDAFLKGGDMQQMIQLIKRWWPVALIFLVEVALVATNLKPGTYLVGWDNLFPEFNFSLNFERSFFGVWQEYRGVGYEDGMSHTANLVHYILVWFLHWVLPQETLRYAVMFLLHFVGGVGIYVLLQRLLSKQGEIAAKAGGLLGALFYQYSFATIQMFYLPFEVFVTHFAYLPWLLWAVWRYIDTGKVSHLFILAGISFLSTPQAHVPTVFIVSVMVLGIALLTRLFPFSILYFKRVVLVGLTLVVTNAFWGFPFAFSAFHKAPEIANSKNNQISNVDIFYKNQEYGDFQNTALMRSFSLEFAQYDHVDERVELMMQQWAEHMNQVEVIGWGIFGLILLGLVLAVKSRQQEWLAVVIIWLFAFALIGNDIPGVSMVSLVLRENVPFFQAVFRFVFTKFFITYALFSSLLLSLSLASLIHLLRRWRFVVAGVVVVVGVVALGVYSTPSFKGNFFHPQLKVAIPEEYFETFRFFRKQPKDERIAILPAPWYWSWTEYDWGTIGSGFFWFGVEQPTLDRAFDPWEADNENFYWEVDRALMADNPLEVVGVLQKYQAGWLVVDGNVHNAREEMMQRIYKMAGERPEINLAVSYGDIDIYRVESSVRADKFVSLVKDVPNIGPGYQYTNEDAAYFEQGMYVTDADMSWDSYYLFRSLFTGKQEADRMVEINMEGEELVWKSQTPAQFAGKLLFVPKFEADKLYYRGVNEEFLVEQLPTLWVDGVRVGLREALLAGGDVWVRLPEYSQGNVELKLKVAELGSQFIRSFEEPYTVKQRNCDRFNAGEYGYQNVSEGDLHFLRLFATNSSSCVAFAFPEVRSGLGYGLMLESRNIRGLPLSVNMVDEGTVKSVLEVRLENGKDNFERNIFVIPPTAERNQEYSLYLSNTGIGRMEAVNDVKSIHLFVMPYDVLAGMYLSGGDGLTPTFSHMISVQHPLPFLYRVHLPIFENGYNRLVLWQGYSPYWLRIRDKTIMEGKSVRVNGWATGWQFSPEDTGEITLLFWPQLLSLVGWIVLILGGGLLLLFAREE